MSVKIKPKLDLNYSTSQNVIFEKYPYLKGVLSFGVRSSRPLSLFVNCLCDIHFLKVKFNRIKEFKNVNLLCSLPAFYNLVH